MIKLQADIDGTNHDVCVRHEGELVAAGVDGRSYDLEVHSSTAGDLLIRSGNEVFRCRVESNGKGGFSVELRGRSYSVYLVDPKRLRGKQSVGAQAHGSAQVIAPMPGKVVRLLVELGAQVEAGAGIVVVEAMKMQNEMKAPKAGVVTLLNAVDGATVNAGDVLAEIE
jgi:biotin carboxyl carrier protein